VTTGRKKGIYQERVKRKIRLHGKKRKAAGKKGFLLNASIKFEGKQGGGGIAKRGTQMNTEQQIEEKRILVRKRRTGIKGLAK